MTSRAAAIACPPPDQMVAFLGGELSETRLLELETHMDECAECRAVLSNMARGGPPPSLGRYRIDTVLGSGGMGIVYRGFDPQLARPVAIKVVRRAGDDAAGRARLVREAQALARLSHPNVCHVYDVGTHDEEVWVAMELIDGVQLRQWAEEGRTRDEIVTALLGAAEGIAAAHAASLVHRDIKPENVLVTRDGRPIVTDFGLARHEDNVDVNAPTVASDPQLTATGAIAGTPAYLAPEQLLGDPIDARVDQFAWAVMAWELLTGSRPFPIVFAVRVEAVRAGVVKPASLPTHLFEALSRAMQASPSDRFPTMRDLIDAMRAAPTTERERKGAGPIVPMRGRTAALAGLAVLGAIGVALLAWPKPSTTAAPAPALTATTVPTPTPTPAPAPAAVPAAVPDAAVPEPAPPAPAVAVAAPQLKPRSAVTEKKPAPAVTTAATREEAPPPPGVALPAPAQPQIQVEPDPPVIVSQPAPPRRGRYCRSCQIAMADSFCRIPADFANTGYPKNFDVVDWGTVTKVESEAGTFRDETIHETVITVRGQRKTYRFTADFMDSYVDTKVGALIALCPEDESDFYQLAGGPTDRTRAVITLSAPPKTLPAAKLGAKHTTDLSFAALSIRGKFDDRITATGRYMVRAKIHGIDGPRYRMDRYFMQVPKNLKGEDKLESNKSYWFVVEGGEFVEIDGKQMLVVKALAVLDDIFPGP